MSYVPLASKNAWTSSLQQRLWDTLRHASSERRVVESGAATTGQRQALPGLVMELVTTYMRRLTLAAALEHPQEHGAAPPHGVAGVIAVMPSMT